MIIGPIQVSDSRCGSDDGCGTKGKFRHSRRALPSSRFRNQVADALHNDAMGPPELDALQIAGAQELVDSAVPTDTEHFGSAINGDGQAIVENE
jgi:hypothetical protein